MNNLRRVVILFLAGLLGFYFFIALTPVKNYIGRHSPATASWFSPPLFNFSHTYEDGRVLEFEIGMTKEELFRTINKNYAGHADLTTNCTGTTSDSVVSITPSTDISSIYGGGSQLCARLDARRLGINVQFHGNTVSEIEVYFLHVGDL